MSDTQPALLSNPDPDVLEGLELRVRRAAELIQQLRAENVKLRHAVEHYQASKADITQVTHERDRLLQENNLLRQKVDAAESERKEIGKRVQKILGQLDLLGNG